MTVSITVNDITLTYNGPYTGAGLHDLVDLARRVVQGSGENEYGFEDETWVFGDRDDVLSDHYGLTPGKALRFNEFGKHEIFPDPESPTAPAEEW